MSNKSNASRNTLIGLAAGGAIGALAALFLGPEDGRKWFSTVSQELQQGFQHAYNGERPTQRRNANKTFTSRKRLSDNPLVWGGVAGALVGAISCLLLAPKTTRKIRNYLADSFEQVSDRTLEMVNSLNEKGQEAAEVVTEQGLQWAERALELADSVNREVDAWTDVVRAAAVRAQEVAEDAEDETIRQQMREIIEWSQKALEVTDRVTSEVRAWSVSLRRAAQRAELRQEAMQEATEEHGSPSQQQVVADIMEWAALGVSLWQNFRGQRR